MSVIAVTVTNMEAAKRLSRATPVVTTEGI